MNTFIKSLFSLVLLFVLLGITSCKNDTFDPMTLRGTWVNEEWGGKNDPDFSKIETYKFEKFNIGMYFYEETRGETRLNYRESSFSYTILENTLTITFSDGSVRARNVTIDKNLLIMAGDTTRVYTRVN